MIEKNSLIKLNTQNVTREVSQFQFLVWPDHGVPKSTSDIFRFRDRTLEAQPNEDTAGPILVHCRYIESNTKTV